MGNPDPADLLQSYPLAPHECPPGEEWVSEMYRTRQRPHGRRLVVRAKGGRVVADSDDCYDAGNAINRALWQLAEVGPIPDVLAAAFAAGYRPGAGCIDAVYCRRWMASEGVTPQPQ